MVRRDLQLQVVARQDLVGRDHHVEVVVEIPEEAVALGRCGGIGRRRQEPEGLGVGRIGAAAYTPPTLCPTKNPGERSV
jgi:hypothetical protein